jgi:NADPH2:quinone reductase
VRAIAIDEFGGRDNLREMDLPTPRVGPDVVLIRIRAAGLNPVDWKLREGGLEPAFPHVFPVVPGWDAAGTVERVGPAVTRFQPGDEVFAYCRKHFVGEGTYAEYVAVPDGFVAPMPSSLDFAQAAAFPLTGLTARQALVEAMGLHQSETVLIHAAGGGVGGFAVQIANRLGARAIGTASAEKHAHVRDLGATETIDYAREDFVAAVREAVPGGVDVVFDTIGGETLEQSIDALRDGGRIVSIAEPPAGEHYSQRGIQAHYMFVRPDGGALEALGAMADDGRLRVHLEQTWPLQEAAAAMERLEGGHVTGKLALTVD